VFNEKPKNTCWPPVISKIDLVVSVRTHLPSKHVSKCCSTYQAHDSPTNTKEELDQHKTTLMHPEQDKDWEPTEVFVESSFQIAHTDHGEWQTAKQFQDEHDVPLAACKSLDMVRRNFAGGASSDGLVKLRPDLNADDVLVRQVETKIIMRKRISPAEAPNFVGTLHNNENGEFNGRSFGIILELFDLYL
jgi:hypothetical protein